MASTAPNDDDTASTSVYEDATDSSPRPTTTILEPAVQEKTPHVCQRDLSLSPILAELRTLSSAIIEKDKPIISQAIWTAILQVIAVILAILFGVFSILAYMIAEKANNLSEKSNLLALLSYCQSDASQGGANNTAAVACERVQAAAAAQIASLATTLIPPPPPTSTSSLGATINNHDRIALGVGVTIRLFAGISGVWLFSYRIFQAKQLRSRQFQSRLDRNTGEW